MSARDDTRSDELLGLTFRLAGIPVRVEATFVLAALIVGRGQEGWWRLGWFAVVFVSILVHELGHAVTLRAFGDAPRIKLWAFGGLTYPTKVLSPARDVVVALAGSLTQIVVLGVPATIARELVVPQDLTEVRWWLLLSDLAWVSVGWAILNLLPILPLDGGLVTRRILGHRAGERGELAAVGFSIATALAGAAWAYGTDRTGLALYAIFFAGWNVVTLVRARDGRSRERLDEGRRQLRAGQKAEAESSFRQAAEIGSHRARAEAGETLAWLLIDGGRMDEAREVAGRIREEPAEPSLLRSYLDLLDGRTEEAATRVATWWLDAPRSFPGTIVINEMDRAEVLMPFLECLLSEPGDAPITIGERVQESLHLAGRYRSSIAVGTRLLDDARSPAPMVTYNIACSTAREGRLGLALDWLDRAVEAGWEDVGQLTGDEDLTDLHSLPRFEVIMSRVGRRRER